MRARVLLLLLLAFPVAAQQPFVSEAVEVTVVNIDAVVTDRSGRPIPGLKASDFEVLENGVPVAITNFSEVRERAADAAVPGQAAQPPAPEALQPRRIVFFVDEVTLTPATRNRLLDAGRDFVREALRPQDQVMIVRWREALTVELPLTSDATAAITALERMKGERAEGGLLARERADAEKAILDMVRIMNEPSDAGAGGALQKKPDWDYFTAERYAEDYARKAEYQLRKIAGALQGLAASLTSVPGKKLLLYAGEMMPMQAGKEMFVMLDAMKDALPKGRTANAFARLSRYDLGAEIRAIGEAANTHGITIYPIQAAESFHATDASRSGAGVDYLGGGGVLRPSTEVLGEGFLMLADATGGRALSGSAAFDAAFDSILSDLRNYYSLGYRATGGEDVARDVEVRLKKRGFQVRSRRSFQQRSFLTEVKDLVAAHLFYPPERNDLGVTMTFGPAASTPEGKVKVPVELTLPMDRVLLQPDGANLGGKLSFLFGFIKENGSVSDIVVQPQQFAFPAASRDRRKELTLKLDVITDPGTDVVSVGVIDMNSRATGFTAAKLGAAVPSS